MHLFRSRTPGVGVVNQVGRSGGDDGIAHARPRGHLVAHDDDVLAVGHADEGARRPRNALDRVIGEHQVIEEAPREAKSALVIDRVVAHLQAAAMGRR